jgi:hypothetical protein
MQEQKIPLRSPNSALRRLQAVALSAADAEGRCVYVFVSVNAEGRCVFALNGPQGVYLYVRSIVHLYVRLYTFCMCKSCNTHV